MVQLVPMEETDFQTWRAHIVPAYAEDNAQAGYWSREDGLAQSEKELSSLLPDGLSTEGHYFFSIRDGETKVGTLWFSISTKQAHPPAFIYDFEIFEQFRRKGYGMQSLLALEELVKGMGVDTLLLHVFSHNPTAVSLYERAGYIVSSVNMRKDL